MAEVEREWGRPAQHRRVVLIGPGVVGGPWEVGGAVCGHDSTAAGMVSYTAQLEGKNTHVTHTYH